MDSIRFFTGARHAWPEATVLAQAPGPVRVFVVGNAGAGKSTLLDRLEQLLLHQSRSCSRPGPHADGHREDGEILLIDDLHLLAPEQAEQVRSHALRSDASIVVASRPWGSPSLTGEIADSMKGAPSLVLGRVTATDVRDYLDEKGMAIAPGCVEHLMSITGGVAWLVSRALSLHEGQACRSGRHDDLDHALQDSVLHRLDTVDEDVRRWVELTCCLEGSAMGPGTAAPTTDDLGRQAFAEGLLLRNGQAVPVVRAAVRRSLPAHRIVDLGATGPRRTLGRSPDASRTWGDAMAGAFLSDADRTLGTDPRSAEELYRAAMAAGASSRDVALHRAMSAWNRGALDEASAATDGLLHTGATDVPPEALGIAASIWACRGLLPTGTSLFAPGPALAVATERVKATIVRVGSGIASEPGATEDDDATGGAAPRLASSTLEVAARMLEEGLSNSLERVPGPSALTKLVRASELYNAVGTTDALPELPAVIATIVALGAGELATAQRVIDAAVDAGQCGAWARRRLLLWQSLVAIQGEDLAGARAALAKAEALEGPTSARDEFLRLAILVTLARRYEDVPALESAWTASRDGVRFVDVDLYLLLPLSSLVAATARLGDSSTLEPQFARATALLRGFGSPPLWSSPVDWAGVQRGILLNRPNAVAPHAQALVAASPHSKVVERMAHAGAVWLDVLRSTDVDVEAVEEAARSLASIGLAWDGARLAAHGAGRSADRRAGAKLLTVARQLHPPADDVGPSKTATRATADGDSASLSERELQVARMVVEGKTYSEIGQAIFISPRTVEHHVAHIRRRLSAGSRSELISRLRQIVGQQLPATSTPGKTQNPLGTTTRTGG